jgi:DNA-binding GntR family transcriptional regulator
MENPELRFKTAEHVVYEYLRDCILTGKLRGGVRLDQDEIAAHLGFSRMPVREAIKRLDAEGLVVSRPHRGVTVTTLGPDAVLELFEMRGVLEGLAVSTALRTLGEPALGELFVRLDDMLARLDAVQSDPIVWVQRHQELHQTICAAASRPYLVATIQKLHQSVAPYTRLYLSGYKVAEMPGFDHRALLEAMKRGDPDTAGRAMRDHIVSAATGAIDFLRRSAAAERGEIEAPGDGSASHPDAVYASPQRKE